MIQVSEIMVPVDYFLQLIKNFPDEEVVSFLKKIGWSKHTKEVQLLMIKELFMPLQLQRIAGDIDHLELADLLDERKNLEDSGEIAGMHDRYVLWGHNVVKNYCNKMRRKQAV